MATVEQLLALVDDAHTSSSNGVDMVYDDMCGTLSLSRENCDGLFFLVLTVVQIPLALLASDPSSGPLKWMVDWVERSPSRVANAKANSVESHKRTIGNGEPTIPLWVLFNVGIPMHHLLGAAFALPAYAYGSPTLFRIAISFELGTDVVHYFQMACVWLFPPGPLPFNVANTATTVTIFLHHLLGTWFGTISFFMLEDWKEAQLLAFCLYVCVLPHLFLTVPIQLMEDFRKGPTAWGIWHALMLWFTFAVAIYVRFYLLLGAALKVIPRVVDEFGLLMGIVASTPLVLFGLSNVGFVALAFLTSVTETARQLCKDARFAPKQSQCPI